MTGSFKRRRRRLQFNSMQIIKRLLFTSSYLTLTRCLFSSTSAQSLNTGNLADSADCKNSEHTNTINKGEMSEAYCPGVSSVAFVTTPDEKSAKKLAHGIIENKLAACVNIIPQIQSIYLWEGKVNEDNEYLMMIKTRSSRVDELAKYVRENHPYSVAEVISLPIENGNLPYLNWITQTVPEKK